MTKSYTRRPGHDFKRETEFLLIATQNNTIRTNYTKTKINNTPQNPKCTLSSDKYETIDHIISECSKQAQREYKTRHNWLEKVINWESCKKLTFDHNKWYMHKPVSVLKNKTHKIFRDFKIQIDHLIPARRPNRVIINKTKKSERTCCIVDFAVPSKQS